MKVIIMEEKNIKKILVIEDTENNINAAKEQLKKYDLIIVSDYRGFLDKINNHSKLYDFDVVLTDMYFPEKLGEPIKALGWPTAICCSNESIPLIGIVSATNHHEGCLSRSFSSLYYPLDKIYMIDNSKVMYFDDDSFNTRDTPKSWDKALSCLIAGKNIYKRSF